jgi:hypothetical protein
MSDATVRIVLLEGIAMGLDNALFYLENFPIEKALVHIREMKQSRQKEIDQINEARRESQTSRA